ncbi:hypothetical protein Tco_0475156 [Tanacetum coccineum]
MDMSWYENSRDLSLCYDRTMPPKRISRGDPLPPLTQDTVNRMIHESVKAAIWAEQERVRNEANCAGGPNVAPIARNVTFRRFIESVPYPIRGNEGAVGLIRWIEKTEMVFTVSKCIEGNKVVFAAATFQDRALTWVKDTDISSYTTHFNELALLCPKMVPTEQKKVEAYIRGLSENIKGEVTSSEPTTLNKAVADVVTTFNGTKGQSKSRERS